MKIENPYKILLERGIEEREFLWYKRRHELLREMKTMRSNFVNILNNAKESEKEGLFWQFKDLLKAYVIPVFDSSYYISENEYAITFYAVFGFHLEKMFEMFSYKDFLCELSEQNDDAKILTIISEYDPKKSITREINHICEQFVCLCNKAQTIFSETNTYSSEEKQKFLGKIQDILIPYHFESTGSDVMAEFERNIKKSILTAFRYIFLVGIEEVIYFQSYIDWILCMPKHSMAKPNFWSGRFV